MAHLVCILALLCFALYVAENAETNLGYKDLQHQQGSFSWAGKLQNKQDLAKTQDFVDLLNKVFKSENEHIFKASTDTEKPEKNRRGLGSSNSTQPQRAPGCRVFFWKSWTAC